MKQLLLGLVILVGALNAVIAAPPASCRDKFVGTWKYFGGSTVIRADGTAIPSIGVEYQTWTCQGDRYIFSNPDGQTWTATLSADGNTLIGPGNAKRVGAAKATAKNKGNSVAKKGDGEDGECPVTIRSRDKGAYHAANPCRKTSVLVVVDTIDAVQKCERSTETIMASDSTHLIHSYFFTRPKKIFQCSTITSAGKKAGGCTYKALKAKYGVTC